MSDYVDFDGFSLSAKEADDLETVLDLVLETFDFHSDLTDLKIPIEKILEFIKGK